VTRRRRTHAKAGQQRETIAALREVGGAHAAGRLKRCMEVRLSRRHGSGWPEVCRSPGCRWCGPTLAHGWWRGIERWIVEGGDPVTLAVLPLNHGPGGLRAAVARQRRALRDVRDRAARRNRRWRGVAIAGMAAGDRTALVLVRHPGVTRGEAAQVLRRRWPSAAIGDVWAASPSWEMPVEDAAQLARARRGVEPLRIVVLAQRADRDRGAAPALSAALEPMPVAL
jgi:hypothetical protein